MIMCRARAIWKAQPQFHLLLPTLDSSEIKGPHHTTENVVEKSVRQKKNYLKIDIVDLASEAVALGENIILVEERKEGTFNF